MSLDFQSAANLWSCWGQSQTERDQLPMEEYLNEFQECEPVQLEPFIHQVGGHSSILCLDERTVCKPLIKQELQFYESLPSSMKKFTPEYRGVVQVRFEEDKDGYLTVAAYPPKSFRYQPSQGKKGNNSRRIRVKNSGSIEIEIESELSDLFVEEDPLQQASSSTSQKGLRSLNPWVLKCHQRQLSKLRRSATIPQQKEPLCQKFLLLENITWRFEYPCILDLKMGTRQYGDDATPAKIESQSVKAANSTSVQLGVRICGMQVYQQSTGKFLCRNKYYGRKLSVDGFKEAICQFLHNGKRLRTDAVLPLIEKLKDLKSALSNLDTYRFYTSSLLLTYEGLDPDYNGDDESSMASADSEMTDTSSFDSDSVANANNGGLRLIHNFSELKGPSSFLGMIPSSKSADEISLSLKRTSSLDDDESMPKTPKIGNTSVSSFSLETVTETACDGITLDSNQSMSNSTSVSNVATRGSSIANSTTSLSLESVDVRMIDFAHATHSGVESGKEHEGPDAGYIFGLGSLIKILSEILEESCSY